MILSRRSVALRKHVTKLSPRIHRRDLHLHEYQSQSLLKEAGLPIPRGIIAKTVDETRDAIKLIGGNVVIKPQVLLEKSQRYAVKDKKDGEEIAARILSHRTGLHPLDESIPAVSQLYVEESVQFEKEWHIAMTVDRENYCPAIRLKEYSRQSPSYEEQTNPQYSFVFTLTNGISDNITTDILKTLQLPETKTETLRKILQGMFQIFSEKEAINLETHLLSTADGRLVCSDSRFFFDDAAQKRQPELFALRDSAQEIWEEFAAEEYGLVYVRMDGNIGNVVNGAGLAMATNDAISLYGGASANFLDAGGQATKKTMLQAFMIIMGDERVKAILVNIYGGITRCDMIAESIIAAASELGPPHSPLRVPMVVRLQGTNSEAGLKLLSETDLGIYVEADFGEAARKAVELANQDS